MKMRMGLSTCAPAALRPDNILALIARCVCVCVCARARACVLVRACACARVRARASAWVHICNHQQVKLLTTMRDKGGLYHEERKKRQKEGSYPIHKKKWEL